MGLTSFKEVMAAIVVFVRQIKRLNLRRVFIAPQKILQEKFSPCVIFVSKKNFAVAKSCTFKTTWRAKYVAHLFMLTNHLLYNLSFLLTRNFKSIGE
jgi:hypothetical protein